MGKQGLVSVRRANPDDLNEVALVWYQSASLMDGAPPQMPSLEDMRARIDEELNAGWDLYLAKKSERVVGMLAVKCQEAILDQIFVHPDAQGEGIGTSLMNFAKKVMPNGFELRMAEENERAAKFYEQSGLSLIRQGFHPRSARRVSYYCWEGR